MAGGGWFERERDAGDALVSRWREQTKQTQVVRGVLCGLKH